MPPEKHPTEIANLAEVEEAVSHCAAQKRYLGESLVLGLHRILMEDVPEEPGHPVKPGSLRDYTDKMDAAKVAHLKHQMSPAWRVREDLVSLLEAVEQGRLSEDPVGRASRFHYRFVRIHPFCDGNGRMARALSIFLMARDYSPEVLTLRNPINQVILDHRKDYVDVLEYCDGVYKELEGTKFSEDQKLRMCESAFTVFYARAVLTAWHKHVVSLEEEMIGNGYTEIERTAPLESPLSDLSLESIRRN